MACFACPTFKDWVGKKMNFEVCLGCALRSKMMMREPPQKVEEQPALFSCPKDGQRMLHTTQAYDNKLIIQCNFCQQNYFGNTERFTCRSCKLNVCKKCRDHLFQGHPPKCAQVLN
jgi:hypothetical protein